MPTQQFDWDVELKLSDPAQSVTFIVESQILLGRTPNGSGDMTSVDLTPYNAVELGVSRRHGVLVNEGDSLTYYDLGGGNGSALNQTALQPQETVKLQTGDILTLGNLRAEIVIRTRARRTTILATRPDFRLAATTARGQGQRLLVVEDDNGLAEMYRIALERIGYQVQTVREMVAAIRALNFQMPAAILLDLMLPGIRGLELARYVRRDTEAPNVPIVVVSALGDKESIRGALEAGVDVFMNKPVDWRELSLVIGTLVGKGTAASVIQTKRLRGTARLESIAPEMRHDTIVTFIDNYREPMTLVVKDEITLGRQNPAAPQNHIDLDAYEAFDKGVSRVHVSIRRMGDLFEVKDLDSANGTFLNGQSINPHAIHTLKNGDELRLGALRLRMYFLAETELPRH
jgi:CheY-like chemotaxis protein